MDFLNENFSKVLLVSLILFGIGYLLGKRSGKASQKEKIKKLTSDAEILKRCVEQREAKKQGLSDAETQINEPGECLTPKNDEK